jgi:predicted ester cyclase
LLVKTSYLYIRIGLAIRLLRNIAAEDTRQFAQSTLLALFNELKEGDFQVTLAAMESDHFRAMINAIVDPAVNETLLGEQLAQTIRDESKNIETVVFPESSIKRIYVLPNRRFNSEYLLSSPQKLLKEGTFEKLDDLAKQDISSACRCILFGEATASAFHILRATESVLKSYYFHHKKQKRLDKPMWGPMLSELKAKTKNKPPVTLLSSLDLIRTAYRNPTQHPEASYEIDSAQDLFGVCLDAIGKMGSEL